MILGFDHEQNKRILQIIFAESLLIWQVDFNKIHLKQK